MTLSSQAQKIGNIETALTDSDGRLTAVEKLCNTLQAENIDLKLKLDDLENHLQEMKRKGHRDTRRLGGPKSGDFYVLKCSLSSSEKALLRDPPKSIKPTVSGKNPNATHSLGIC